MAALVDMPALTLPTGWAFNAGMKRVFAALLVLTLAAPALAGMNEGLDAYNRGDYTTALREWRPMAEQGDANAQFNLGFMYQYGRGVPQDHVEAVKWYRKAAEQGHAQAQYNLGTMYRDGHGVQQDYVQAYMWNELAAASGDNSTQGNQHHLYSVMTLAQIAEAQKLAREWQAAFEKRNSGG